MVIAIVTLVVIFVGNRLTSNDIRWFNRLRRPRWLTFEFAIPLIWITIFISGAWSAYVVWEIAPSLANSDGCTLKPKTLIQRCAPSPDVPTAITASKDAIVAA